MFAYCLNNPVIFSDHLGMIPGYSYIPFSEEMPKFDGNRSTYLPPEEKEYIMDVVSAKKIQSSEDGGYYKGVWIHKSDLLPSGSGVSYVMVAIASDVNDYQTVMHEYGHFLHLTDVGLFTYTGAVAIPSFLFSLMYTKGLYQGDYYSLSWEYIADQYGQVRRDTYEPGAAERAYIYWEATILFSQTVKDMEGY